MILIVSLNRTNRVQSYIYNPYYIIKHLNIQQGKAYQLHTLKIIQLHQAPLKIITIILSVAP